MSQLGAWAFVIVRYRREIVRGIATGWRRRKTYYVTCSVNVSYAAGATWQPLDADYFKGFARA